MNLDKLRFADGSIRTSELRLSMQKVSTCTRSGVSRLVCPQPCAMLRVKSKRTRSSQKTRGSSPGQKLQFSHTPQGACTWLASSDPLCHRVYVKAWRGRDSRRAKKLSSQLGASLWWVSWSPAHLIAKKLIPPWHPASSSSGEMSLNWAHWSPWIKSGREESMGGGWRWKSVHWLLSGYLPSRSTCLMGCSLRMGTCIPHVATALHSTGLDK